MNPDDSKKWQWKEADRLIRYQHQHRGLDFIKLLLPPPKDRKVNLVGVDNHIYRGTVAKLGEHQLPPDVDEESIDLEALCEEIRNYNFPPVPPQEPLGPSRRVGGEYTLSRKLHLAPINVNLEELEEIAILGEDGGIYKGTVKFPSKLELDRQLRGSKKPIQKVRQPSSSRGFVEPTLVVLQTGEKPHLRGRPQKSLVEIPASNVGKIIELVASQNKRKKDKDLVKGVKDDLPLSQDKDETTAEESEKAIEIDESSVDESEVSRELSSTKTDESDSTGEMDESGEDVEESESSKVDDESENITETEEFTDAKDTDESESSGETEEFEIAKDDEELENAKDIDEVGSAKETEESSTAKESEESSAAKETEASQSVEESEEA